MSRLPQRIFFKNPFVRKFMGNKPHITCFYYGQKGHEIDACAHRKGTYILSVGEKLVWMRKASTAKSTNSNGPKKIWVPTKKK